jgi:hypothetical protein
MRNRDRRGMVSITGRSWFIEWLGGDGTIGLAERGGTRTPYRVANPEVLAGLKVGDRISISTTGAIRMVRRA